MVFVRDEERLASTEMKRFERKVMRMPWFDRLPWLRVAGVSVVMTSDEIEGIPLITTFSAGPDLLYRLYRLDPEPAPIWVIPGIVTGGGSPTSQKRWWLPEVILWEGELDAGSGGWLVTHFAWHPDIKIGVDGVFRRAVRSYVAFASTPITSGVHDVRVVFAPRAVALGILVSSLALLIVVVLVVAQALRQSSEPSVAKA